jgi:uncharacterized membrane protein YoaK (UPF0700 family)
MGLVLTALAIASGVTDVATFVTLGNVFTSAMTGNTALLGIALSQGRVLPAVHSLLALLGFAAGVMLGTVISLRMRAHGNGGGTLILSLLLTELVFMAIFATTLSLLGSPTGKLVVYALILLSSIGMGIQGVAARCINSRGINTIVFTSTLVTIVMSLTNTLAGRSQGNVMQSETKFQIGVFFAYGLGAVLAGILVGPALVVVAWIPTLAVLTALGCCAAAPKGSLR